MSDTDCGRTQTLISAPDQISCLVEDKYTIEMFINREIGWESVLALLCDILEISILYCNGTFRVRRLPYTAFSTYVCITRPTIQSQNEVCAIIYQRLRLVYWQINIIDWTNVLQTLSDVWLLEMGDDGWKWKRVEVKNQEHAPAVIFGHPACKVGVLTQSIWICESGVTHIQKQDLFT